MAGRSETPSRQALERAFERMPRFLRAVGRIPRVASALERVGYTHEVHTQGWGLLHTAAGYRGGAAAASAPNPGAAALAELDDWDERGFAIARAVLDWSHPEQAAFVFAGLKASRGAEAVVGVKRFLDRLDALAVGAERVETREADQAALADLATAGIDQAERQRLRALVEQVEAIAPTPSAAALAAHAQSEAAAERAMFELHAWYGRWSALARIAVTRKRDRIALGVSSATQRTAADADPHAEDDATPDDDPAMA